MGRLRKKKVKNATRPQGLVPQEPGSPSPPQEPGSPSPPQEPEARDSAIQSNLTESNLTESNPTESNLTESNPTESNLTECNLTESNLTESNLTEPNLTEPNPTESNPTEPNPTESNPTESNLTECNLTVMDISSNYATSKESKPVIVANTLVDDAKVTGDSLDPALACQIVPAGGNILIHGDMPVEKFTETCPSNGKSANGFNPAAGQLVQADETDTLEQSQFGDSERSKDKDATSANSTEHESRESPQTPELLQTDDILPLGECPRASATEGVTAQIKQLAPPDEIENYIDSETQSVQKENSGKNIPIASQTTEELVVAEPSFRSEISGELINGTTLSASTSVQTCPSIPDCDVPVPDRAASSFNIFGSDRDPIPRTEASNVLLDNAITPDKQIHLLPPGWSLQKLALDIPLSETENITCVSSFESNLYIGTSAGHILHFFLFDDAEQYMLILQIPVQESSTEPVSKILPVPDAKMCLCLAGNVVHSLTLPELSPCRTGKIKDATDMLLLSVGKLHSDKNKSDKVVVYTATKLRVVHVMETGLKLLRDINYTGASVGISLAHGTLAHYSNICIIASDTRFDVVDMQQSRKIPLFDYNPAAVNEIFPFIIPFSAEDTPKVTEEYMLPICTEQETSMAMFVNSAGNATRGTLTWVGDGYPRGGLSVVWPYVIGIYQTDSDFPQKVIFSSLLSLEAIASVDCDTLFGHDAQGLIHIVNPGINLKIADPELLRLLAITSVTSRTPISPQKQFGQSKTMFTDGCQLFCFQEQSELAKTLAKILNILAEDPSGDTLSDTIEHFSNLSSDKDFNYAMQVVLVLLSGDISLLKLVWRGNHFKEHKMDPRLLMLYCVSFLELSGALWENFSTQSIFLDIRDMIPESRITKNKNFFKWLIEDIYTQGENFDELIRAHFRKLYYKEVCENALDIFQVIKLETDIWLDQNTINNELLIHFADSEMYLVLLHIFLLKQKSGSSTEPWALKLIDLSLDLLSGQKKDKWVIQSHVKGVFEISSNSFDLVQITFDQLRQNVDDETLYTKKLLKLLQLCPDRGIVFLKSAKGNKFSSTHKLILGELSKSYEFDSSFIRLKIEYTEQSFFERSEQANEIDFEIARELLEDYQGYFNQKDLEVENENLNILYTAYQVENDLKDPLWPKIAWIEYLYLHHQKSECEDFLLVYLKTYELLLLFDMYKEGAHMNVESKNDAITFLKWVFNENIDRPALLRQIKDFTTAEWLAFYVHPPVPRSLLLLKTFREQNLLVLRKLSVEESKTNLLRLIEYYLAVEDCTARFHSVMHAVNSYANGFLTIEEVLSLLPESFPLMYIEKFISVKLQELDRKRSDAQMKKALHKANAKLNKAVLEDFEATTKILSSSEGG